jgi:hypothetical protein
MPWNGNTSGERGKEECENAVVATPFDTAADVDLHEEQRKLA